MDVVLVPVQDDVAEVEEEDVQVVELKEGAFSPLMIMECMRCKGCLSFFSFPTMAST